MFSKPVAFVLLALGCLTAAAGGAYVATRHNLSDAAAASARTITTGSPAALAAPSVANTAATRSRPVAETEAAVTPKAAAPASRPTVEALPERTPVVTKASHGAAEASTKPVAPSQPAAPAEAPAAPRPVQRTIPLPSTGAPVATGEPAAPPSVPAVPPASSAPPKPMDAAKPAEDTPPEPATVPQYEELILPAASVIGLQVETSLSSERARVEDRVDARVSRDVMAGGRVAIPAGSRVIGSVTTVERGGKMKDQARLGIRFHTLILADGTHVALQTDPVYRFGEEPSAASSKKIGGAAIGGAILGAILGGGKGAAIGGAAGAGAGSAAVMAGDRSAAFLRPGEYLNVKLASPATITVEKREE